jgi:hypothetical protein
MRAGGPASFGFWFLAPGDTVVSLSGLPLDRREPLTRLAHPRLELRVRILPQLDEPGVVLARPDQVAFRFVQLGQPLLASRAPAHPGEGDRLRQVQELLKVGDGGVGLAGAIVGPRQQDLGIARGNGESAIGLSQEGDAVVPALLGEGDDVGLADARGIYGSGGSSLGWWKLRPPRRTPTAAPRL